MDASSDSSDDSTNDNGYGLNIVGGLRIKEFDNDLEVYQFDDSDDSDDDLVPKSKNAN